MIVKYTQEKKEEWDACPDSCVFAYNTSKHASALYTPFEIMFGRKAVLPIDISVQKDGKELLDDFQKTRECVCEH